VRKWVGSSNAEKKKAEEKLDIRFFY